MRRRGLLVGCVPAAALVAFLVAVQSVAFADESYHAVSHPNMLMINNGFDGSLYITKDITRADDRGVQRVRVTMGACKRYVASRTLTVPILIHLDGHRPYPAGTLLISGPTHIELAGKVILGVAPASPQRVKVFESCDYDSWRIKKP